MQDVEERMQALGSSDVCALFLLSVESREAGKVIDLENGAERAASLLSRFFRITDIVGYLGENRFAAFLTGHLTSSVVWEKGGHAQRGAVVRHGADAGGDERELCRRLCLPRL